VEKAALCAEKWRVRDLRAAMDATPRHVSEHSCVGAFANAAITHTLPFIGNRQRPDRARRCTAARMPFGIPSLALHEYDEAKRKMKRPLV
jgi:hypothetical protein